MKKTIIIQSIILYIISIFWVPSSAIACFCIEPSFEEAVSHSDIIFKGKVLEIQAQNKGENMSATPVLFEVAQSYKGIEQSQVIINVDMGTSCNYPYPIVVSEEHLIYTNLDDQGNYYLHLCVRGFPLNEFQAVEDLSKLGEGKKPTDMIDLSNQNENTGLDIRYILFFSIIGIIIFFLIRRIGKSNRD
ncbi:hypothetical protein [Chengkuizengella sediminis]|uniref:hypothetical protein n=1 Tax=Chengkuizengella sediminis TaxID=1885917 RepID=UPI001389A957|nr:hypothetical protein [Chengkuizengella sediminis]NDI33857.1 hypothetical protein [Chengkuizengella sediminis]